MSETLKVVDWSQVPFGRYDPKDGDYNGQKYREEVLVPALKRGAVHVLLDGTAGYGSSFLEEVFGGLVRVESFTLEDLKEYLKVSGSGAYAVYEKQVWSYINAAVLKAKNDA